MFCATRTNGNLALGSMRALSSLAALFHCCSSQQTCFKLFVVCCFCWFNYSLRTDCTVQWLHHSLSTYLRYYNPINMCISCLVHVHSCPYYLCKINRFMRDGIRYRVSIVIRSVSLRLVFRLLLTFWDKRLLSWQEQELPFKIRV